MKFEEAQCKTCRRLMDVPVGLKKIAECQNCYTTKLELMEKEKSDERRVDRGLE